MRRVLHMTLVFLVSLGWFSVFQPWGSFPDPDAFYHAKMAALIAAHGPVRTFSWLDLTSLGAHFADQHFLFHVLLIPFEWAFGMLSGTQVAAVVFAALFLTVLYAVLRRLAVAYPLAWTVLAGSSSALIIRLSLAKASPLALIWFVLGMAALIRRSRWPAFLIGLGFALTHGGWMILLACQVLYVAGETVYARFVEDQAWRRAVRDGAWRVVAWTAAGVVLGLWLHPNAKNLLTVLWTQAVTIGLGTPFQHVILGQEWLPVTLGEFVSGVSLFILAGAVLFYGLAFAARKPLNTERARQAIAFALPAAALFALTIKSRRSVEYFVPALTLWFATLGSLIDPVRFRQELSDLWRRFVRPGMILLVLLLAREAREAFLGLRLPQDRHFNQFTPAVAALAREAKPGERIFHSSWDQFPQLFAAGDQFKYVAGIDPTFFFEAHPDLSDLYRDLTLGRTTSSVAALIRDRFGAHFVFLEPAGHTVFRDALRADPLVEQVYQDATVEAYRIR